MSERNPADTPWTNERMDQLELYTQTQGWNTPEWVLAATVDLIAHTRALREATRAAEARVAEVDDNLANERELVLDLHDATHEQNERIAALEATMRAIVADCRVPRGDYLGDACRWCDNTIDRDGHRPGCPVGILAATPEDA